MKREQAALRSSPAPVLGLVTSLRKNTLQLTHDRSTRYFPAQVDVPVEHGLLLENLLDLAHAPFTHTTTFARGWPIPEVVRFHATRMLAGALCSSICPQDACRCAMQFKYSTRMLAGALCGLNMPPGCCGHSVWFEHATRLLWALCV